MPWRPRQKRSRSARGTGRWQCAKTAVASATKFMHIVVATSRCRWSFAGLWRATAGERHWATRMNAGSAWRGVSTWCNDKQHAIPYAARLSTLPFPADRYNA